MVTIELSENIVNNNIQDLEFYFLNIKNNDRMKFRLLIDKLKLIFIDTNEIYTLNKIALLFNEFKIHSGVPLIVSKLLSGSFDKEGGTLIYSLGGLRRINFVEDLQTLWKKEISYEMEQMLFMIGIQEL